MFWLFFRQIFFFIDFLGSSWNFPHFWNFDPQPPAPGRWTPGVGWAKICFIDFLDIHGSHWHWLIEGSENDVITSRIHCDVISHTTARRRSWQLSPDSEIGPSDPTLPVHSWGQFLVGTIPRSIRICVPNLVMIGPAVWPPILDRQTDTHTHTHTQTDRICII